MGDKIVRIMNILNIHQDQPSQQPRRGRRCFHFGFLSDPSPIIVYPCNSLTHSCLVNLIEVTLVFEDANSKLVELVTVADVDA